MQEGARERCRSADSQAAGICSCVTWGSVNGDCGSLASMGMTLRFEIFPADLDATADFYVKVLGFQLVCDERHMQSAYLSLQRDSVMIGAAARAEVREHLHRRPPMGVELVLEADDVDAELARVTASGWPVAEDLVERPWGLRDFRLLDPSGYYLRITQRIP